MTEPHASSPGEPRDIGPHDRPSFIGLLDTRITGTASRRWVEREYTGDDVVRRRLLELRRHTEFRITFTWCAFLMCLPPLIWILSKLATLGSNRFWQAAIIVVPAVLAGPATGMALSRAMDWWVRRRVRTQTVFRDPTSTPRENRRSAFLMVNGVWLLLWISLSLIPPHQFVQNLFDLLLIPGVGLSMAGAGLVSAALFSFDGDEIVCTACRSPASIEDGKACHGCERDFTRIESRSMGRPVVRVRLLMAGFALLALATAVLLFV